MLKACHATLKEEVLGPCHFRQGLSNVSLFSLLLAMVKVHFLVSRLIPSQSLRDEGPL